MNVHVDREQQWTIWSLLLIILLLAFVTILFGNTLSLMNQVGGWVGGG